MVLGATNTQTLRDSIIAEVREQQQPVLDAAARVTEIIPRIEDAEAAADAATTAATNVSTAVARVDPGAAGTSGQALHIAGGQPRWLEPNAVSPLLYMDGAVPDGVTDNYAAIMQAYDKLGTRGGTIDLGGRKWFSAQTLEFFYATKMTGGQGGHANGGRAVAAEIIFPRGITGIRIKNGYFGHVIEHLGLSTEGAFEIVPAGLGNGIEVQTQEVHINNVNIRGFGQDGVFITSSVATGNSNFGQLNQVRSEKNGRHGMYWEGSGSNVWTVIGANVSQNRGYGIYNTARYQHTFMTPHAAGNLTGDYFDDGRSCVWLTPYAEAEGKFVIGANSNAGVLLMGAHGAPSLWYGDPNAPTTGLTPAITRYWTILRGGEFVSDIRIGDGTTNHTGAAHWRFRRGAPSSTAVQVYDDVTAKSPFYWTPASLLLTADATHIAPTAGNKVGFFGATPAVQQPANPNTTGATLAQLEAEVNELKAMLRAYGLLAT